jgi:hypothetical protein
MLSTGNGGILVKIWPGGEPGAKWAAICGVKGGVITFLPCICVDVDGKTLL